jgi:hypothetical protein
VTAALIIIPGLCYALAAFLYARERNWALMIVYAGYALANCGLLWLDRFQAK